MAKLTAPLLGLSARGTIADTITYSGWKGIDYARQRVIPANPQTIEQSHTRDTFRTLGQLWVQMQALARAPWIANAVGKPYTHRNSLIKSNLPVLREQADMTAFVGSPGALAGLAPASISAAYAAPNINITLGAPTLPVGWTIQGGVGLAFHDQSPEVDFVGPALEAEDLVTPYVIAIDVTSSAVGLHICSAWFRYLRPDARIAYGVSLTTTATKV